MSRGANEQYEPTWQMVALRAKEQRFREVALADSSLSAVALAERFSLTSEEVVNWCRRLGVPRPPPNDMHGLAAWLKGVSKKWGRR